MDNEQKIIELVGTFMALCSTITTNGSSKLDSYHNNYQELREELLAIDGLNLPLWIRFSTTPASVMSHVKMERGSGNGTWSLRRDFFQNEKMQILSRLSNVIKTSSVLSESPRPLTLLPSDRQSSSVFSNRDEPQEEGLQELQKPVHHQPIVQSIPMKKKLFIVHGHDAELKFEVARLVIELGFDAVIFHDEPKHGRTILQKLIELTDDVVYAIVLYTACDTGKSKKENIDEHRARQNVVFEHGFLLAKLGQGKVAALKQPQVVVPSDLSGVLYIDTTDNWKYEISKELRDLS